jgi:hypothetical protein
MWNTGTLFAAQAPVMSSTNEERARTTVIGLRTAIGYRAFAAAEGLSFDQAISLVHADFEATHDNRIYMSILNRGTEILARLLDVGIDELVEWISAEGPLAEPSVVSPDHLERVQQRAGISSTELKVFV